MKHEDMLTKYQSDLGESVASIFLQQAYGLVVKPIPRKKGAKTPDFEIYDQSGKNLIAVCEVKSCTDALHASTPSPFGMSNTEYQKSQLAIERGHFSKLEKHHNKAVTQFEGYTKELPRLVFFASFDMTDYIDLDKMLQEQIQLYNPNQMADCYMLVKVHQGIIPSNTFEVKYSPALRFHTEKGKFLCEEYMSLEIALKGVGMLPLVFNTLD